MGAYFRDGNANVTKVGGMFQNQKVGGYFGDGHGNSTHVLGKSDTFLPVNYIGYQNQNAINITGSIMAEYLADRNMIEVINQISFPIDYAYGMQGLYLFTIDLSPLNLDWHAFKTAQYVPTFTLGNYIGQSVFNIYPIGNTIEFDFSSHFDNLNDISTGIQGTTATIDCTGIQLLLN